MFFHFQTLSFPAFCRRGSRGLASLPFADMSEMPLRSIGPKLGAARATALPEPEAPRSPTRFRLLRAPSAGCVGESVGTLPRESTGGPHAA